VDLPVIIEGINPTQGYEYRFESDLVLRTCNKFRSVMFLFMVHQIISGYYKFLFGENWFPSSEFIPER
jgi:hypothetical protein